MKKGSIIAFLVLALFFCGSFYLATDAGLMSRITLYLNDQNIFVGYGAYVALLILSVVIVPITVTPLIPLASTIFGPLLTSILTIVGWTFGSSLAFLIAQHAGRPLLERLISFKKIDSLVSRLPEKSQFVTVALLHVVLPSEVVSYTFGLTKSLSFVKYFAATLVGTSWSAIAFSFGSAALLNGDVTLVLQIIGLSIVIFAIAWYLLRHSKKSK